MFALFAFNGLLSQLVSLGERKSQAVTADRGLNESFIRVDVKSPSEHRTHFGAERKLANLSVIDVLPHKAHFMGILQSARVKSKSGCNTGGEVIDKRSRIRLYLRSK